MSQILMVFHGGRPLFRRAGHLRLALDDDATVFDGDLVRHLNVTSNWTLLASRLNIELVELEWGYYPPPPQDARREVVLRAAGFGSASEAGLIQEELNIIDGLLSALRSNGEEVEQAAREVV